MERLDPINDHCVIDLANGYYLNLDPQKNGYEKRFTYWIRVDNFLKYKVNFGNKNINDADYADLRKEIASTISTDKKHMAILKKLEIVSENTDIQKKQEGKT